MLVLSSVGALALVPTAAADHTSYNVRIRGFQDTWLDSTVFIPAGATANSTPFVLMTHGWAGSRTTTPTGRVLDLLDAGYGVLTWDSRGFGQSGGQVELNSPDYEVRDVSAILDHLVRKVPQALKEGPNDPVVGMSGGSYAGGIQLLAAAHEPRIDVIAPEITWNDLTQSLAPNGVPKLSWTTLLFGGGLATSCSAGAGREFAPVVAGTGCQTPDLARYYAEVHATNGISDEVRAALEYRSPKNYNANVLIPTLLIQGFPDTLFDVNQAAANYEQIKANNVPVKLWLYDGGHALPGTSLANTQGANISKTVVTWFDRHLKGDANVDTGPEVEYYLGNAWHSATSWPVPGTTTQTQPFGGVPPLTQGAVGGGSTSTYSMPIAAGPLQATGPMTLRFRAAGLNTEGIVFASLSIQNAGATARVDGQVQPIRFEIDLEGSVNVESELVQVAVDVPDGATLFLTLTSFERDYNANRVPGYLNINHVELDWARL